MVNRKDAATRGRRDAGSGRPRRRGERKRACEAGFSFSPRLSVSSLFSMRGGFSEGHFASFHVKLNLAGRAESSRAFVVELALPASYDNGGETVADDVDAGAPHDHQ